MAFPYIYTFYSYKGGVGRSMALLNVAYTLAGRGRHVLIVDMDIEAPGVSDFLRRHEEIESHPSGEGDRDVLSLLEAALAHLPESDAGLEEAASLLPPLPELHCPVRAERLAPLQPKLGTLGRLDVLGAEFSPEYLQRLAELRLKGISRDQTMRLSDLLRLYFKNHRFAHRPLGVEIFEEPIQTPYDYILIDSRTGVTEIGGLCVGPLADRLVVLTGLNDQNVEGTATLLREIGINLKARGAADPKWDEAAPVCDDDEESHTLGPKPTILVATPVPPGETELKRKRLAQLKERLGIKPATLSYFPRLALMEALIVRDFAEEPLSREYYGLTRRVMEQVSDDAQSLMGRFSDLMKSEIDLEAAVIAALRLASVEPQLAGFALAHVHNKAVDREDFPLVRRVCAHLASLPSHREIALGTWGSGLSAQAKQKQGEEADRLFELAYQKYEEALRIKSDNHENLSNWGAALSYQAKQKQKQGEEADRLFELAYHKYEEALRIKPDMHDALLNWGATLSDQAKQKQGEESDRLFELAGQKYEEALRIKPDKYEALFNWGLALFHQGKQRRGGEAERLFELAGHKYEAALRIKPHEHGLLSSWGLVLSNRARLKQGEEADRLFELAYQKYEDALRIKPDKHEALSNWGLALSSQAKLKQGADADCLFDLAYQKYGDALRIKPDMHEALSNWGVALSDQGKQKQGEEADRLFKLAYQKYEEALRIKPDRPGAMLNWGAALSDQGKQKQGEEADRLFELAYQKFGAALRIKPHMQEALSNWGEALSEHGSQKQGEEADRLLELAYQKYEEVLRIKPDEHEVLLNWGTALMSQSSRADDPARATSLRREARVRLMQAHKIQPGSSAYNLACLSALESHTQEAIQWLDMARSNKSEVPPLSQARLADDPDFATIRQDPDFLRFVQTLPPA